MEAKTLAKIIYEELERDHWGDIDPYWFANIAEYDQSELDPDSLSLLEVLERVVTKLKG